MVSKVMSASHFDFYSLRASGLFPGEMSFSFSSFQASGLAGWLPKKCMLHTLIVQLAGQRAGLRRKNSYGLLFAFAGQRDGSDKMYGLLFTFRKCRGAV